MTKRCLNLPTDAICDLIELSEEENYFSKINSGSGEETVSIRNIAGTSGYVRTARGGVHDYKVNL
jgi:hypothetical protein